MPRTLWISLFLVGLLEVYSLLPVHPSGVPSAPPENPERNYRTGIIHVHSMYSDGGGSIPEIAEAAKLAGQDFVVVTDHNTSAARREGFEKAYGNTDVYVEMEATTPAGHCVVFYSHTDAARVTDEQVASLAWQHFLGREARTGLFIATAHPSHVKNPWSYLDRFPDGMEVMNFDAMWQREVTDSMLDFGLHVMILPFNEYLSALRFFQPYGKDFSTWDGMNAVSKEHFAYLGHDTHAKLKFDEGHALRWPDYLETFKLASNVIYFDPPLATDFEARKRQLYKGLRDGRAAIVFQSMYPFAGNDWRFECDGDNAVGPGQEGTYRRNHCRFFVSTPEGFPYSKLIRLFRNGNVVHEVVSSTATLTLPVESEGLYRLEVWGRPHTALRILLNRPVPYVFYNPIRVR